MVPKDAILPEFPGSSFVGSCRLYIIKRRFSARGSQGDPGRGPPEIQFRVQKKVRAPKDQRIYIYIYDMVSYSMISYSMVSYRIVHYSTVHYRIETQGSLRTLVEYPSE